MKWLGLLSATMLLGILVMGCDWTSSGQDGGWSSSYEVLNFSGVYRGRNGGPVLSGTVAGIGESERSVNESFATGDGSKTTATGNLSNTPIVPGSVTVQYGGSDSQTFTDSGTGQLNGTRGGSGTINYATGSISINTGSVSEIPNGISVVATYRYRQSIPDAAPGQVLTLNVTHTGQRLDILTSTGVRFDGRFGGINSSGMREDSLEDVVAEFSATATIDGRRIRMVGVFQTTLTHYYDVETSDDGTQSRDQWFTTSARVINATWTTEGSSSTLDIYAEAPSQEIRRTN